MHVIATREGRGLLAAILGAVGGAIAETLVFPAPRAPLWGESSVGVVAALSSAVLGGAVFAAAYVLANRGTVRWRLRGRLRRILDLTGLTFTAAGVALLLVSSVYAVLQLAFRDLDLDRASATAIAAATVGAFCYALVALAEEITSTRLATLLGLFLIAGTFGAMLNADDPSWWQHNFSTLGMGGASSASLFNLTVIVAGLVLVTLADYLTIDLRPRLRQATLRRRSVLVVRVLLVAVGLCLVGVGVVPVSVSVAAHNAFAYTLLAGFGVLIVAAPILLDDLSPSFGTTSIVFAGILVVVALLFWPIGYFNLTAVEFIAVLVVFTWVIAFTRSVQPRPRRVVSAPERPDAVAGRQERRMLGAGVGAGLAFAAGAGLAALVAALLARRRQ